MARAQNWFLLKRIPAWKPILFFAALTLLFVNVSSGPNVDYRQLEDEFHTPYVVVEPKEVLATAVIFHGKRCSSSMMLPLAKALAKNGVRSLVPDLPGRGRSSAFLDLDCKKYSRKGQSCNPTTEIAVPILDALTKKENLDPDRTVLIGHSYGGALVEDLLPWSSKASVINLEGFKSPNGDDPRPHLIFQRPATVQASFGSFFKYKTSHLHLLYEDSTVERVLNFLKLPIQNAHIELGLIFLRLFLFLAAGFFFMDLVFDTLKKESRVRALSNGSSIWFLGIAAGVSLLVLKFDRLGWLPDGLSSTFSLHYIALVAIGMSGWMTWGKQLCEKGLLRDAALAVLLFSLVYLSFDLSLNDSFFHVRLEPVRWPRFLFIAFFSSSLFAVVRKIWPRWLVRLFFWMAFFVFWSLAFDAKGQFDAVFFGLFICGVETISSWAESRSHSCRVGVLTAAMFLGWSTMLYPLFAPI